MRQHDPAERAALAALRGGKPRRYLEWATAAERIATFTEGTAAVGRAIELWHRAVADTSPAAVAMIARDNQTREELNAAARELWRALGLLGEERTYGKLSLSAGDRVICRRNDSSLAVDNGMRGSVAELYARGVVIETDGGKLQELPSDYVADHLEHGYALTGHSMQGSTIERAVVLASTRDLTAGWSYTALSRARAETSLLIIDHCRDERSEFAPGGGALAREPLLDRVARRMLQRDDEDLAVEHMRGDQHPERPSTESRIARRARQRLEDLEARISTLREDEGRIAVRLPRLTSSRGRPARQRNPDSIERAHLDAALKGVDRELQTALDQRGRLLRGLGDAPGVAPDHGLERGQAELTHRHEYGAMRTRRRLEPSREMEANRDLDRGMER
jgi:hypothetical protein